MNPFFRHFWLLFFMSWAVFSLPQEPFAADGASTRIRMATTTSTENSGLLDYLLPHFEKQTGFIVDVIAVGTGKALKLAERGDVDIILVHAPEAEMAFINAGRGVNRRAVMANDFLIVGPPSDPAGLKKAASLDEALEKMIKNQGIFVSRGDDSGTHKKERTLWPPVDGPPQAPFYLETGQGMEATLRIAHEKTAYTLTDRGTFLAVGKQLDLVPVFESAAMLENPYSIIVVNPARHGHVKYLESMHLLAWMTSPEGQALIGAFKKEGEVLFHPIAVPNEFSE
jgi:tungstate transport system substrate-binding protein